MTNETRRSNPGRIFWGLVLILVGALILAYRFDFWDFGYLFATWWPAVFILIGLSILIGNGFRNPGTGIFFILFGTVVLLWHLDILHYEMWRYLWPAGLIILGLWILLRPASRTRPNTAAAPVQGHDIDASAVFSSLKRRVDSRGFKGGEVAAVFGSVELDLLSASLEGGKATLEATAVLGSVTLLVPRDWRIVTDGTPVLGSYVMKHQNPAESESTETLYVHGAAVLGSVTIKN